MSSSTADEGHLPRSETNHLGATLPLSQARTRVFDTDIFHEEAGQGPPLVLLHGINDSHRTWKTVVPELARSRRVLVPDLPGCGLSGRPDASYSLEWQAKVVVAWLEALGIEQADMAGHSYGGGVAQHMLLVEPKRIRRLALVAAGGLGRAVAMRLKLASLPLLLELVARPAFVPIIARALRLFGFLSGEDEQRWYREVNTQPGTGRALARTIRDVVNWRGQTRHFLDRAVEIQQFPPIALFWCTKDSIIPHAHALATLTTLKGAQIITFHGCGHFSHQERPHEFVRALTSFLDSEQVSSVRCVLPKSHLQRSLLLRLSECVRSCG